jgi:hypothetical protein
MANECCDHALIGDGNGETVCRPVGGNAGAIPQDEAEIEPEALACMGEKALELASRSTLPKT